MRTSVLASLSLLALSGPLASAPPPAGGGLPALFRSYPLPPGLGGGGDAPKTLSGDFTGDGLIDVVYLRRDLGVPTASLPGLLDAAHVRRSTVSLPDFATDLALNPEAGPDGRDLLLGVEGDQLQYWAWNDQLGTLAVDESYGGPWGTDELTAIAAATNDINPFRYVVVAGGTGSAGRIYPMLFLGDLFFAHMPSFPVGDTVSEIALADLNGDGQRDELGVLLPGGLSLFRIDGQFIRSVPGTAEQSRLLALPASDGGSESLAFTTGPAGGQELHLVDEVSDTAVDLGGVDVSGLASGDLDGNGRADLVLGPKSSSEVLLFWNQGGHTPFNVQFSTSLTIEALGVSQVIHPSVADHDGDGDVDLVVLTDDLARSFLGTLVDEDDYRPGGNFTPEDSGGGGGGRSVDPPEPDPEVLPPIEVTFTIYLPPAIDPTGLEVAYLVHEQHGYPDAAVTFMTSGSAPILLGEDHVDVLLELPTDDPTAVFYVDAYVLDPGPPRRGFPLGTWALTQDEDTYQQICDDLGEDCFPKDPIWVVKIPYIPNPIDPPGPLP